MPNPVTTASRSGSSFAEFVLTAPLEVVRLYDAAHRKWLDQGKSDEQARHFAAGEIRRAGWFRTNKGWKRLSPDVRDKVNVRAATPQPDGRFLIEDVDVFYPNAVKQTQDGDIIPLDRRKVLRAIQNTNASIRAGGPKPQLTEGHSYPEQKAMGVEPPAYGDCFNWREHPEKPGHARCDLLVDPIALEKIRDKRLPRLSAQFTCDAGGLNLRFASVAMLGSRAPALSRLPETEVIYSAANQFCFAAPELLTVSGRTPSTSISRKTMPCDPEQMKGHAAAIHAAYAAQQAGEPGADDKLQEAFSAYEADAMPEEEPGEVPGAEPGAPGEAGVAAEPVQPAAYAATAATFRDDPELAFAAQEERVKKLEGLVTTLSTKLAASTGRIIKQDWEKAVSDAKVAGHQFSAEQADDLWAFAAESPDPAKGLERAKVALSRYPKNALPETGLVFGADGLTPAPSIPGKVPAKPAEAVADDALQTAASLSFSADEAKLGQRMQAAYLGSPGAASRK